MPSRVSPTEKIRGEIDALFGSGRDLAEVLEDVARLGARLIMQAAVEAEVEQFLGRARYQRRAEAPDCSWDATNATSVRMSGGVLVGLAWIELGHRRVERATVLLGAAAATRDAIGLTPVGAERIETEMALDAARAQLNAETFPATLARGRGLATEQALRAALDPG